MLDVQGSMFGGTRKRSMNNIFYEEKRSMEVKSSTGIKIFHVDFEFMRTNTNRVFNELFVIKDIQLETQYLP